MKKIIVLIIFIFLSMNISFASDISELKYDRKPEIKVIKDGIIVLGTKDGKSFVSKNGIKGKLYSGISNLIISKEGNFSYIGEINGKNSIIENGKELNICQNTDTFSLDYYNGKLLVSCYKNNLLEKTFSIGNIKNKKEIHQYYYNGKNISSKDYFNFIKNKKAKIKKNKQNIKNKCKYTNSIKREKDGFYHIFKDGKSIKKFKYSNQRIYCYNNGNNIFYLFGDKPKYASSRDSKYNSPDSTVIYTLVTENKKYKTKLDNIKFYQNGKDTAFILSNLNYEDELYVNGKLIKKIGNNSWINNFLFSPIGNNYMFTYIENQNKTYLYENGKEIFNKKGFGKIQFNYYLNGDSYYITKSNEVNNGKYKYIKDFLFKNGKKILDKKNIEFISYNLDIPYILIRGNKKIINGGFTEYKDEYYLYNLNNLGKDNNYKKNIIINDTSYKNSSVTINLKAKGNLLKIYKKVGKNDVEKGKDKIKKIIKKRISNDKAKKIFENISSKFVKLANKKDLTKKEVKNIKKYTMILYLFKDVYQNEDFMDPRVIKDGYLLKDIFPDFKF